ncbi:MAG TPA: hypothetical protein PKI92_01140 [Candidatus Woesebacteria bacterium]|nr:hypothetical protein [Candidatus Woesebacteria bacterium]HPR99386.1 hypothetical protein [Candidatus Woesebacteria bacterium]
MAVYLTHDNDIKKEVHLKIKNKRCSVKYVHLDNPQKTPIEFVIKHKGIKSLLKLLKEAGYRKGNLGEATTLPYFLNEELVMEILLGSFLGDIIFVYNDADEKFFSGLFPKLITHYSRIHRKN